ncbi:MAG: DNA internalization-related competence protein ComEC/Rec2, partial [Halioglobus sp.]|nr:DNA internalization-related competence protein ComEC/Rec2 [Halioglobus sp.]
GLPGANLSLPVLPGSVSLILWLPALWVLLPRGCPGRYVAWLALAAVVLYRPPAPPKDCVDIYTLDVGQGLASVIRTRSRALLFDTGPAYRNGGNSAEYVILPFLQSQAIRRLDMLVVSHSDQDHAGGVTSVLAALPVAGLLSGETLNTGGVGAACVAGQTWRWDGVDFALLSPEHGSGFTGNNASCVLAVSAGDSSLLLTGDIERPAEQRLSRCGRLRPVKLVHVPHHGSATSSSAAFVDALQADVAVVSAGYGNRWGFPKESVVTRWRQAGATVLNTAESGAIQHRLCRNAGITLQREYRRSAARYWHDIDD